MEIQERPLDTIRPYENNPRNNDEAVPLVKNSIQEFGFKVPIVIDRDGVIVAGHTRYKAARELGMETVPCVVADDLTPEQVRAFRIADNKVAEAATWDVSALSEELDELEGVGVDMDAFGDFAMDLDDLIADIDEDRVGDKESKLHTITLDGTKWNIADDEAQMFRDAMLKWIDENGIPYGFIRSVLS